MISFRDWATRGPMALALSALPACSNTTPREAAVAPPSPTSAPHPNVLLVIVDDLYVRIGVYGEGPATPNLKRLARRGRRFDRAYVQFPLCNPSRASLLTGWRPERTLVWGNADPPRAHLEGATPLQEHFQAHGYFTARLGKVYHSPFEHDFRWDLAWDPPGEPEAEESRPSDEDDISAKLRATSNPDQDEPDGRTVRRTAELLAEKRDRPFFLAVGLLRPHGPWIAPQKYFDLYPPGKVRLPEQVPGDLDDVPRVVLKRGAEPDIAREKWPEVLAAYYACVSFMDAQVGVLLDALDRQKLWDSTILVLVSDNGIQRGEHGLWRKNVLFEESTRVPLLMATPGLQQPGVATRSFAELVDIYPTLTELAGLPSPTGLQGTSLAPLLQDPSRTVKTAVFTVTHRGRQLGRSIRTERYRFTRWRPDAAELYDLEADPHEYKNLARDPQFAKVVEEMQARLVAGYAGAAAVGR
jgi:uncharacterized sulfatase